MRYIVLCVLFGAFASCIHTTEKNNVGTINAYVPVYATVSQNISVTIDAPQNTVKAGKIYAYQNYIFQVDFLSGIHVIDNTNKLNPSKIIFYHLPYCEDIAIKGNVLYASVLKDLAVIDIANINNPRLIKVMKNVFNLIHQDYPPYTNCYFECPDPAKGVVVDWVLKSVTDPKCKR